MIAFYPRVGSHSDYWLAEVGGVLSEQMTVHDGAYRHRRLVRSLEFKTVSNFSSINQIKCKISTRDNVATERISHSATGHHADRRGLTKDCLSCVHARCGFIINTLQKKTFLTGAVRKDDEYFALCSSAAAAVAIGQLQLQLSHYSLVALQAFSFPKRDFWEASRGPQKISRFAIYHSPYFAAPSLCYNSTTGGCCIPTPTPQSRLMSSLLITGWRPMSAADWGGAVGRWYVCRDAPRVKLSAFADNGWLHTAPQYSSCQSAATSTIVKRCWDR